MRCKPIIFTTVILFLGSGCSSWPDEGYGGWAEHYSQHTMPREEDHVFDSPINVVVNEFSHLELKLSLLKSQGIRACMPAQLLKAQIYENRLRRLIAAEMWEDAERDLIVHYHGLNQLSGHFEVVRGVTECAPKPEEEKVVYIEPEFDYKGQIGLLLNSDNQFAFDDYELTPKYQMRLAQAADLIKQLKSIKLLIVGHTDRVGLQVDNFELALKRAEKVKSWLSVYGVTEEQMVTLTQGSLQPYVKIEESDGKRHSDRRVEVIILDLEKVINEDTEALELPPHLTNWTKIISGSNE